MRLRPVIDLLKAAFPGRKVDGAFKFASDLDIGQFTSDLYVVPAGHSTGENGLVNAHRQVRTHSFGVVIAARSVNKAGGGDANDELQDVIDDITAALVGVGLPGHDLPISSVRGQLLQFKGGAVVWQETFNTTTQLRRV